MNDNVIEFITYKNALKGNYRKGVHTMRCILENPSQAADFAASVGAVSVVFGVPVDQPDRNSDELLELVLNSSVCDKATLTFLSQFYPENAESYDTMMNSAERCAEIFATPILWRPVGRSNCLTAKLIVTMAGLNCVDYGDLAAVVSSSVAMTAVAASQTAMTAVAASQTAMAAVIANSTALNAVVSSSVAMTAVAASQTAMAAVVASQTAMTAVAASQTAMAAVAASSTAMAAIWQSDTALAAVQNNAEAWATFTGASSEVMGKTVAILAGLDPNSYADMTAVAASSTAMAAVAASSTAMEAVAASAMALNAICKSATARKAFIGSGYRDTYYSKILTNLTNTTYFTAVVSKGAMTNSSSVLYYNGTTQATSTALSADSSFILIQTLQSYNSSSYCYVYDLQTGSTIAHYTHTNLTTANLVIPGGVKVSGIYGGDGHTTYYAFKAK